jgi:hypothetical protein
LPLLLGPPPAVTEIQDELLDADHTQPVGIVTFAMPFPPTASNESVVDDRLAVHGAAACVTTSRRPPIAIDPVRTVPAGFGSTRYVTLPSPVPDAPVSTVIQDAPETADHPQPPATVTSTLELPPAAATFCVEGVSAASHAAPA